MTATKGFVVPAGGGKHFELADARPFFCLEAPRP